MAKTSRIDVNIQGGFGFYLFMLNTRKAAAWVRRNIDLAAYQVNGDTFCCDDTRMAQDIAHAMTEAGLRVA